MSLKCPLRLGPETDLMGAADHGVRSDQPAKAATAPRSGLQPAGQQPAGRQRLLAHTSIARGLEHDPTLLLRAAERLAEIDAELARDVYLEAFRLAISSNRLDGETLMVAEAARTAPPARQPARPVDLLLDGLIRRFTDGYAAGVPGLKRALKAFGEADDTGEIRWWLSLVCRIATDLWDDEGWHTAVSNRARLLSSSASEAALPTLELHGDLMPLYDRRLCTIEQTDATHSTSPGEEGKGSVEALFLVTGGDTQPLMESWLPEATIWGGGRAIFMAEYARAVLCNGLRRYGLALVAAQRASDHGDLGLHGWALSELVEAATRNLQLGAAADALARLAALTQSSATEWALGIEARARALVSEGAAADDLYRESIERLGRTRIDFHLARSHLLYGEWLRREGRRVDARAQLRQAHTIFEATGSTAFAERAHGELLATGEQVRKRTIAGYRELTAQEEHIARLAGSRLTNSEIATQLFISPRTVEWHLRKVFTKLGVNSRRELRISLPDRVGFQS